MMRLILALALLLPAPAALAHNDADWIRQGGYKNRLGELCCGARDCEPIPDNDVQITPSGFRIKSKNETVPYHEATPAPAEGQGRYWFCAWGGKRKCFFAPPGMN